MKMNCKFCLNVHTCRQVDKLLECPAFSRNTCGGCNRYTSFENFGKGICEVEGEIAVYVSDPACEHFVKAR